MPQPSSPVASGSAARQRLLDAAGRVFYAEGIHAVGVDRLIAEAGVTRATFYRHFPGKEDLVVAYVECHDAAIRSRAADATEISAEPRVVLAAVIDGVGEQLVDPDFRGCPFINVAAEHPDPNGPVRRAVDAHRDWFRSTLVDLLTGSRHDDPAFAADLLVMLRDGAQVAAYLGGPEAARAAFRRAAAGVLGPSG